MKTEFSSIAAALNLIGVHAAVKTEFSSIAAALNLIGVHAAVVAARLLPFISIQTYHKPDDLDQHRFNWSRSVFFVGMLFFIPNKNGNRGAIRPDFPSLCAISTKEIASNSVCNSISP